jgi:hypothetical protein
MSRCTSSEKETRPESVQSRALRRSRGTGTGGEEEEDEEGGAEGGEKKAERKSA